MKRLIIASLLILAGAGGAMAETDIFKDVRMPHGHARSQAAKMADVGACGARNGEVSNAKFPAVVACMNARGWRIARIERDPPAAAAQPDDGPGAAVSTSDWSDNDDSAANDAAALAASQAATQITNDGIAQTVQGINGQ